MQIADRPCCTLRSSTCSNINRNEVFLSWMCPPEEWMLCQLLQRLIPFRGLESVESDVEKPTHLLVQKAEVFILMGGRLCWIRLLVQNP